MYVLFVILYFLYFGPNDFALNSLKILGTECSGGTAPANRQINEKVKTD